MQRSLIFVPLSVFSLLFLSLYGCADSTEAPAQEREHRPADDDLDTGDDDAADDDASAPAQDDDATSDDDQTPADDDAVQDDDATPSDDDLTTSDDDTTIEDDDVTPGDDDVVADDDTTSADDDDATPVDDDVTVVDDDVTPADDDATVSDDDVTPGDDDTTANGCDVCHGFPPQSGSHAKHTDPGAYAFDCTTCHLFPGGHQNGHPDIDFGQSSPANPSGSFSEPNCSGLYCHSNGQSTSETGGAEWGGSVDCNSCHDQSGLSGRHRKHLNEGLACDECHATASGKSAIADYDLHVNGVKDYTGPVEFSNGSCSGSCHGKFHLFENW